MSALCRDTSTPRPCYPQPNLSPAAKHEPFVKWISIHWLGNVSPWHTVAFVSRPSKRLTVDKHPLGERESSTPECKRYKMLQKGECQANDPMRKVGKVCYAVFPRGPLSVTDLPPTRSSAITCLALCWSWFLLETRHGNRSSGNPDQALYIQHNFSEH